MATYTSTQAGNWTSPTTWGEASAYPNADADIVNVGHEVTYNPGDSAIAFGNITITTGGVLIFPTGSTSRLLFNTSGGLTVNSGGELRAGTSSTPIGAAYKCRINWPNGSSARSVLSVASGGILNIYGDPAYYGSDFDSEIQTDFAYSPTGLTIYIKGDFASKWLEGQWIVVERNNATYVGSSYQTQARAFLIDSIGAYDSANDRTPITVTYDAGIPDMTFYTGGWVLNLSRNIEIGNDDTTYAVYAYNSVTEYPRIAIATAYDHLTEVHVNEANFKGFDWIGAASAGSYNLSFVGCSFVNNNYAYQHIYRSIFDTCVFFSHNRTGYGGAGANVWRDCYFLGNQGTSFYDYALVIRPKISSCSYACQSGYFTTLLDTIVRQCASLVLWTRGYAFRGLSAKCLSTLVQDDETEIYGGNVDACSTIFDGPVKSVFSGVITNYTNLFYGSGEGSGIRTKQPSITLENTTLGTTERALRIYHSSGCFLPLIDGETHWQAPSSGSSWISEFTPTTRCRPQEPAVFMPSRDIGDYVSSGAHTITLSICPSGWATTLDQDDIYLTALYYDGTGTTRFLANTGAGTFANDGWRDLTVSFTAGRAGIVYFNLYIARYESGAYILIDPVWSIS